MRKPTKPEDPEDLRKKLTDSGRTSGAPFANVVWCVCVCVNCRSTLTGGCCAAPGALSEEESGEKKLTDRGLTGLKARFSMKRKGSMSDVTADGVSSEDDTAEEAAPFTPPMSRYATIAGAGSFARARSLSLSDA
jgi:hypothetical protein